MRKKIFIVRHGETDFNRHNIVQGSGVDTELNEFGHKQAEAFYKVYGHIPFDTVYTSALRRTMQSVSRFIENGVTHEILTGLNEISWGDFEGKQQTSGQKQSYLDLVKKWNNGDEHAKIVNGESPYEVRERQRIAVNHILGRETEKNVLICMHGRAMKVLMCLLFGEPLSNMEKYAHSNLCLYEIDFTNGSFGLVRSNDIEHLKGLL